jgi:hypothetical protein
MAVVTHCAPPGAAVTVNEEAVPTFGPVGSVQDTVAWPVPGAAATAVASVGTAGTRLSDGVTCTVLLVVSMAGEAGGFPPLGGGSVATTVMS